MSRPPERQRYFQIFYDSAGCTASSSLRFANERLLSGRFVGPNPANDGVYTYQPGD
jgi:hypothetical protein